MNEKALIVGAGSGLSASLARICANNGMKVILASRNIKKLDKLSKEKIYRSTKNIPNVKVTDINHFSAFDIAKFKKIVFTESSIKELEKKCL